MIDSAYTGKLPRSINLGALLFLLALPVSLVALGMVAVGTSDVDYYRMCSATAPPDLMQGLLCSTLTLAVTLVPIWLIFPPTRRAVERDEEGLSWDRPSLTGGLKLMLVCLLIWGQGLGVSMLTTREIRWYEDQGCDTMPEWAQHSIEVRRSKGLTFALGLAGIAALTGWRARRKWRPAGRVELDERGLVLDGERWSYKDIDRAELDGDSLRFGRFDGATYVVPLFHHEQLFAQELVRVVRSHLPQGVEDRSDARQALTDLSETR